MRAEERKVLLEVLVTNYCAEKRANIVYGRENSTSYMCSYGRLMGACMAFECDFEETKDKIIITTRNGKILLEYDLD